MMLALAALRGLVNNLGAGARVALFLPVARQRFHLDAAQLVLLVLVSALVDFAGDAWRAPPGAMLDWAATGAELASFAVLMLIAAVLAWALRDSALVVALPIVVLASLPLVQVANVVPWWLASHESALPLADTAYYLLLAWFVAVLARSAYVALQPAAARLRRALVTGALLAAPLLLPPGVLPENAWWSALSPEPDLDATNPASEAVLALQRQLQDEALDGLADRAPGETQVYFVGFAPDGAGRGWRARLDKARQVMDGHWGTEGRSLVYVNDTGALTEAPMASVTFLREALQEIAAASSPDEDILMLYVAGRSNADGSVRVSLPPLGLVQLSGAGLAHLLDEAGFVWRVVVVATCEPRPFVEALAGANTLVLAAAASAPGAPGCASGGEPTALGDVLFGEASAGASSLKDAFDQAHRQLAARGASPSMHLGTEIAAQLGRVRAPGGGRASWPQRPAAPFSAVLIPSAARNPLSGVLIPSVARDPLFATRKARQAGSSLRSERGGKSAAARR